MVRSTSLWESFKNLSFTKTIKNFKLRNPSKSLLPIEVHKKFCQPDHVLYISILECVYTRLREYLESTDT